MGKRDYGPRELLAGWGLTFNESELNLVNTALTHPSYVYENPRQGLIHNQRLEFLGDAILGMILAEYLYRKYPGRAEGELTKMRAAVVCEGTLARQAQSIGLGDYLRLGRGEELSGGRQRPSTLADAFEAMIGAVYLARGIRQAKSLVIKLLGLEIKAVAEGNYGDYKTALQEIVQRQSDETVKYVILAESGPDHAKRFLAGVQLNESILAEGEGRTKKEAEQAAAREALKVVSSISPGGKKRRG